MNIFKKFIFLSFIRPFLLTFSVVMLILLMQFLWKYIDDLIGKGLEFSIIIELLWYSSLTLIPIALPLSILLASMMLMGRLAEKSEIIAMNALGQPFTYILQPLLLFSFGICMISFTISNYSIPYANLKATNLMYDIIQKKLTINIQEKVFFSEIDGYSIRVEKKENNEIMKDVIIYDYTSKKGIKKIFIAESAKMSITPDNNYLLINLYNGESHNEISNNEEEYILNTKFSEYNLSLDLSSFQMERTSSDRFSNKAKTMNISQLKNGIDSLETEKMKYRKEILSYLSSTSSLKRKNTRKDFYTKKTKINQQINKFKNYTHKRKIITQKINKFEVELHRKITLAIACIIMLIIGAPFGAIIKKGGFGLPVIFSIILFLVYHVISITGEKMVKKDILEAYIGMWASSYIMITIGILLIIVVNNLYLIKKI